MVFITDVIDYSLVGSQIIIMDRQMDLIITSMYLPILNKETFTKKMSGKSRHLRYVDNNIR
jgi:hypothetical protein